MVESSEAMAEIVRLMELTLEQEWLGERKIYYEWRYATGGGTPGGGRWRRPSRIEKTLAWDFSRSEEFEEEEDARAFEFTTSRKKQRSWYTCPIGERPGRSVLDRLIPTDPIDEYWCIVNRPKDGYVCLFIGHSDCIQSGESGFPRRR
jgi:hypothetical protein